MLRSHFRASWQVLSPPPPSGLRRGAPERFSRRRWSRIELELYRLSQRAEFLLGQMSQWVDRLSETGRIEYLFELEMWLRSFERYFRIRNQPLSEDSTRTLAPPTPFACQFKTTPVALIDAGERPP